MLTIFATTEDQAACLEMIQTEARLEELIDFHGIEEKDASPYSLIVQTGHIELPMDWEQTRPPILFPRDIPFDKNHLLGLIFHLLENDQKTWQYLQSSSLYPILTRQNKLKYGLPFTSSFEAESQYPFLALHNKAVIYQYGHLEVGSERLDPIPLFLQASEQAPTDELRAFSLRELATAQLDRNRLKEAEASLQYALEKTLSTSAQKALELLQIKIWMKQLVVPIDWNLMLKLQRKLKMVLTYFEEKGKYLQAALLLMDAAQVANISQSYMEALRYISKAIDSFDREGLAELAGSAHLQKGTLLYTWAQNGNPQFYKPAVDSLQAALQVFTKRQAPDVFADIQHKLGVIYAEMPADPKKKGVWAGVSSNAFKAALAFFTKEAYPYEYASICNNFGNALLKYPPGSQDNHAAKALTFHREALGIRDTNMPYERAISLLNYVEACWQLRQEATGQDDRLLQEMREKIMEIKELVTDKTILQEADTHLADLEKLSLVLKSQ